MKYFTEQYYKACLASAIDGALQDDVRATKPEQAYKDQIWSQSFRAFLEQLDLSGAEETTPAVVQAKEQFRALVSSYVEQLQELLPDNIRKNVADWELLAMNHASPALCRQIRRFCASNRRQMQRISRAYESYYKKACVHFKLDMISQIGFHDCLITELVPQLGDLFFAFAAAPAHSYITAMRCVKCDVIKDEGLKAGATWLYEEVYSVEDKYELQVLVQLPNGAISDFVLQAQRFEFRGSIT